MAELEDRMAMYEKGYKHGYRDVWVPLVAMGMSCGVFGYVMGLG